MRMVNSHIEQRLAGLLNQLRATHEAGVSMSSYSKGTEREDFIKQFLLEVLPSIYRFGSGDATDASGRRSGQLDIVIETPFSLSLPIIGTAKSRLYLAESIAAVIEVKSDIANQWDELKETSQKLKPLTRAFGATMTMGSNSGLTSDIPLFAVGYTGWKKLETLKEHLDETPSIDGALIIDSGLYYSSTRFGNLKGSDSWALWGLVCCLHTITNSLQAASTNPLYYAC